MLTYFSIGAILCWVGLIILLKRDPIDSENGEDILDWVLIAQLYCLAVIFWPLVLIVCSAWFFSKIKIGGE